MRCLSGKFVLAVIFAGMVLCASSGFAQAWRPLFDGKTLDGWHVRGGTAEYHIEDGAIVGTTVKGSPNTFLCTESDYGDFVLEFEVKCDPALNSGVQVRSRVTKENRVFGYQAEIAAARTASAGSIYDEGRRGRWVYLIPKDSPAAKAYKDDDWNQYRIACTGPRIQTWINGVPCTDTIDTLDTTGFIGLQVHSVGGDPKLQVRWRNIRIRELGRHVWRPLFDGKTLAGWHTLPGGNWEVRDGVIVATSPASEARHGLLVSDAAYGDFTVRLQFKALKGNSGFYFRSQKSNDGVGVHGFQAEIDASNDVGGLYETGGRAWVIQPKSEDVAKYFKPGEWNDMSVHANGRHIVVHVNGTKTAELIDDPGRLQGHFALQLHGSQDMEIMFRNVEILQAQTCTAHIPFNGSDLKTWKLKGGRNMSDGKWVVGTAAISSADPKQLVSKGGAGEMINLAERNGQSIDIFSTETFGDARIEVDVMVPQGSNSGVYVMGEYEIQVLDSWGRDKMGSGDMGAVYGAAPPPKNASKRPGEWQKYVIDVNAPRYDAAGNKIANMELAKVQLNGVILHQNLVLPGPTPGGVSGREAAKGPIMFQGDHGPVAYRNIRITEFTDAK
ncbi:MAG: DUF1080 domain-containing protein [Phycisphaerae bacterium]|nr:DUF1080 domain-containing protein [Phycisphaerae bacterium]